MRPLIADYHPDCSYEMKMLVLKHLNTKHQVKAGEDGGDIDAKDGG